MGRLPRVSAHTWWPSASELRTIVPLKKPLPPMTSTFSIACIFLVMRACREAACQCASAHYTPALRGCPARIPFQALLERHSLGRCRNHLLAAIGLPACAGRQPLLGRSLSPDAIRRIRQHAAQAAPAARPSIKGQCSSVSLCSFAGAAAFLTGYVLCKGR
jgi:hypothetical protein